MNAGSARSLKKRFEILVRNEIFPRLLGYEKSGKWWYKDTDIDIVAINEKAAEIVFAECKWSEEVNAKEILNGLKEKTVSVRWKNDVRKEKYAIFAKSFAKKISPYGEL